MRSSLVDVSNMPKHSSISVVDLNNKETQSILLMRMKCQEQKQLELRRLKQIMMLQSQSTSGGLTSGMSSSSCSSNSPLSPTQSFSPTASSPISSSCNFNNFSANSSINSNASMPDGGCGESADLNSSYPLYKRLNKNLNHRQHQIVRYF